MHTIQVACSADPGLPVFNIQPNSAQLSRLAAMHYELPSNEHIKFMLNKNGFSSSDETIAALRIRISEVLQIRQHRALLGIQCHIGSRTVKPPISSGCSPVLLPAHSLEARLDEWRRFSVVAATKSCILKNPTGEARFAVCLVKNQNDVAYVVDNHMRSSSKQDASSQRTVIDVHHYITVPEDWRQRVMKRRLATVHGLLTLTAQQVGAPADIELFRATWADPSQLFNVTVRSGFIARMGEVALHAETAQIAINTVRRKLRGLDIIKQNCELDQAQACDPITLVKQMNEYPDFNVHITDGLLNSVRDFNVREWCIRVGIDISNNEFSFSSLLEPESVTLPRKARTHRVSADVRRAGY